MWRLDAMSALDRPVVINQIGAYADAALASFGNRIEVRTGDRGHAAPWAIGPADILLTGPSSHWRRAPISAPEGWGRGPAWVQLASVGVDAFPDWLLRDRIVTCGRGAASDVIAEYVFASILLHEKRLDVLRPIDSASWNLGISSVRARSLGGLGGKTIGIAGFGAIGREVARRAHAFGMEVRAFRRGSWSAADLDTAKPVDSFETLAAVSDVLVLALPLTAQTRGIVDAALLARARPGLHLINVARGELVRTDALLAALDGGGLGFATLDVTEPEPLPDGHAAYTHPKIRLTPHVSWSGPKVGAHLGRRIAENIARFLDGRPLQDVVDPGRGY